MSFWNRLSFKKRCRISGPFRLISGKVDSPLRRRRDRLGPGGNAASRTEERVYRAKDNKTFLDLLNRLWTRAIKPTPGMRIRKVSVTLSDLVAATNLQAELFASPPDSDLEARGKSEKLSRAMDKINHRFGRDSVLIGMTPSDGRSSSGSKIAFTRIPDIDEFLE